MGQVARRFGADHVDLRLRPLRDEDETVFRAAHQAMIADSFTFGLGYEDGMAWSVYLAVLKRKRRGCDLSEDEVPATFLVAEVNEEIVGRSSIRHELNAALEREGGHVGYGVLATHRRQGYGTEILRQSLVVARALGIDRVLVTCDDDNTASARIIERCGGELESLVANPSGRQPIRRYWIN